MGFRTKLDYSNNRQIKQYAETLTHLSGATTFGLPFNQLPSGPDLTTSGISNTLNSVGSTFSGNGSVTIFTWYDEGMQLGYPYLSAITPSNSGTTQFVPDLFTAATTTIIDGNTVVLSYSGINYDLTAIAMFDLGGGNYSGTVVSDSVNFLSATTLDFTGRTIWVDVCGTTRTNKLVVSDGAVVGYVLTCINSDGSIGFSPAGVNTGVTSYWTGGTGLNSVQTINTNTLASGDYSLAEGFLTIASGIASHAEGIQTIAGGDWSHTEGEQTVTIGQASHAEGHVTTAIGQNSHAEGSLTIASGFCSHTEGLQTQAIGDEAHAEGSGTQALGNWTHAEGSSTIASGLASHAEGRLTRANGDYSHAGGLSTVASGLTSFVHGSASTANGTGTVVLGRGITGNTADTTYLDKLNIRNIPIGTSITNLGIDANGFVVVGLGSGTTIAGYWTGSTGLNSIIPFYNNTIAAGDYSIAVGFNTQANGDYSFAQGQDTIADGDWSHAEGQGSRAVLLWSHAEGYFGYAGGYASHAEGFDTSAFTDAAHSEGIGTVASGYSSHAQGYRTTAMTSYDHSEGYLTIASGGAAHASGQITSAIGTAAFAGGVFSTASGFTTFVYGSGSTAAGDAIIVLGANLTGTTPHTTYVEKLKIKTGGTLSIGAVSVDGPTLQLTSASLSTGLYLFSNSGITITASTATTFNLGAVRGWIVDSGDVLNANPIFISYSGGSGLTTPYMISSPASYLLINSASTLTIQNTKPTTTDRRQNIYLGAVGHPNLVIDSFGNEPDIIMNEMSQVRAMFDPINLINDGVIAYPNSTDLTLANTSGRLYGLGIGFITNGNYSPTVINVSAGAPTTFQYRLQNSASTINTTLIDPTKYDNGGVLTNVPNNGNATNQRIYLLVDGTIRVQYGQTVYNNISLAKEGAATETFTVFPNNSNLGLLIGILSVRKAGSNLANTGDAIFLPVSKFGETVGATGGISTATLQSAYNNSSAPEILTNSTLLGVSIRRGSGSDSDNILQGQNNAGTTTFAVTGNGDMAVNKLSATTVTANSLTISAVTFNKLLLEKVGSVSGSTFTGTPKVTNVTFTSNFPNTNYAIIINGEDERLWTSSNKTVSGFTINANANAAFTGNVYWMAKSFGEV